MVSEAVDRILSDGFLGDLSSLPIEDLRTRRSECQEIETGLSYLRRMVQGRLDVVAAEQSRRADGEGGDDLEALIARLPRVLAGSTRTPGTGRLPQSIGTGTVDEDLARELDGIISHAHLDEIGDLSDDELATAVDELEELEHRVSGLRKSLFERIDTLQAELTRRYRTGEATVDSLLE